MIRTTTALLLFFLLAGCASPGKPEASAAAPGPDADTAAASPEPVWTPLADGSASSPSAATWSLPKCRQALLTMAQDRDSAAQGLPSGQEPQGDGTATLALLAVDCPAAVAGNTTVLQPFRLVLVYTLLQPFDGRADAVDGFLREGFASDAATAGRMAAFGLPVAAAEIALSPPGEPLALSVKADGVSYQSTGAPAAQEPQPDSSSFLFRLRRADGAGWVWLEDQAAMLARSGVAAPVLVQADGGYLASVLPGGAAVALREDAVSTSALSLAQEGS